MGEKTQIKAGDVWATEHRRAHVTWVGAAKPLVRFVNETKSGSGRGIEQEALQRSFVAHRRLVERDGKAVK